MSKATPGPWRVVEENDEDKGGGWPIAIFRNVTVMSAPCPEREVGSQLDDANLIAAAPKMLNALKIVETWLTSQGPQGDFIREAIAKAEGKS